MGEPKHELLYANNQDFHFDPNISPPIELPLSTEFCTSTDCVDFNQVWHLVAAHMPGNNSQFWVCMHILRRLHISLQQGTLGDSDEFLVNDLDQYKCQLHLLNRKINKRMIKLRQLDSEYRGLNPDLDRALDNFFMPAVDEWLENNLIEDSLLYSLHELEDLDDISMAENEMDWLWKKMWMFAIDADFLVYYLRKRIPIYSTF